LNFLYFERFGLVPDLGIYGKGLGGGTPVSCLVGRRQVMTLLSNARVFHAGTFNTNLLALQSALTTLKVLQANQGQVYKTWEEQGEALRTRLRQSAQRHGVNLVVRGIGQVTYTGFADLDRMEGYRDCWSIDQARLQKWVCLLKQQGIRIISRGLWYLSVAHTEREIDAAVAAADRVLEIISRDGEGAA